MFIDKSHSKKDIIKLFSKHGVNIDEEKTKGNIISDIEEYMENFKYDDKIQNLTQLKDYLKNKSPKQRPTTEEKSRVMFIAKKIIKWGKCNYNFDSSTYTDKDQVYNEILTIYKWGDLPSVRRACTFYNSSPYCINHINPIMTEEVAQEIKQNKIIKTQYLYKLTIRRATKENPIVVLFD